MRKDQPEPHHTFEQMKIKIKQFAKIHNPKGDIALYSRLCGEWR